MAVTDSNYSFIYTDIGSYGKDSNSSIFKRSWLWRSIEVNIQELPIEKCLPGTESPNALYRIFLWKVRVLNYVNNSKHNC